VTDHFFWFFPFPVDLRLRYSTSRYIPQENAMKYMFLMYGSENSWTPEERTDCMIGCLNICDELKAQGKFIATAPLHPVATAATVRVRDGRQLVTAGPFAETTEQLGGFFLLELEDLDEAIAVASRLPQIGKSIAEIRPVLAVDGFPPARPIPFGSGDPKATPYILLCYHEEGCWQDAGPEAMQETMAEAAAQVKKLYDSGRYVISSPLHPVSTATCVRVRNGKQIITDGPFAETHEVLGGFYVVTAESQDEAIQMAARQPGARHGGMEVRQLFDYSGLRKAN
jgi:hypothetical protein